jgi:hypothetical protein
VGDDGATLSLKMMKRQLCKHAQGKPKLHGVSQGG